MSTPYEPFSTVEGLRFAEALIARGHVEQRLLDAPHCPVRDLPVARAHELALAEETVLTTERALRVRHGVAP